jgi:hypothetical protein
VQRTESSLTLTWNQLGIVSDYSVRVTNEEDGDYNVTVNVTQSLAYISGLSVPGGHYDLRLTAVTHGKHSSETATSQITSKYIIYNLYLVIMNLPTTNQKLRTIATSNQLNNKQLYQHKPIRLQQLSVV